MRRAEGGAQVALSVVTRRGGPMMVPMAAVKKACAAVHLAQFHGHNKKLRCLC